MTIWNGSIAATGDDGFDNAGTLFTTNSYLYFGNSSGLDANAFFRFTNVTIPKNSTVSACVLTVKAHSTASVSGVNVKIGCSNEDNAAAPTTASDFDGRTFAGTTATWTPATSWLLNNTYASADFSSSAQSLFARSGWSSGNSMLVVIRNNGSTGGSAKTPYDYSNGSGSATISITYSPPAAGKLFRYSNQSGLGSGGPFFQNPLSFKKLFQQFRRRWLEAVLRLGA